MKKTTNTPNKSKGCLRLVELVDWLTKLHKAGGGEIETNVVNLNYEEHDDEFLSLKRIIIVTEESL